MQRSFGLNIARGANDPSDTATSWGTPRTEDYTYDANFDYLTGYRFDAGAWTTNTYDAAGNRNDATSVDCLNRAGAIGGTSRTYDILGNTLTIGATKSMGWDVLNRMTSYTSSGATTAYAYRADGLRVKKRGPGASPTTTYYRYDGQMPVEEFNYRIVYPISYIKILRYALGARGIDRIERVPMYGSHLVGYPLYDAHGNNIATLTIDHANHFSVPTSDKRSYGPWGDIRTGSTTGEPQPRHCANLGHLSDDESGFVYMRARYYEPGSGRFISEDPGRDGLNWFGYCGMNPVSKVDRSGRSPEWEFAWRMVFLAGGLALMANAMLAANEAATAWNPAQITASYQQCKQAVYMLGLGLTVSDGPVTSHALAAVIVLTGALFEWMEKSVIAAAIGGKSLARLAVAAYFGYSLVVAGFLLADVVEDLGE